MRRLLGELGSLLLALLLAAPAGAQSSTSVGGFAEDQASALKAAFVLNFVRYTEWPAGSFRDDDDPIEVCVLGDGTVAKALAALAERAAPIAGRPVRIHSLVVERLDSPARLVSELRGYEVLFVGGDVTREELRSLLGQLSGTPLLTVGEGDRFAAEGGMLGLVQDKKRFTFDANLEAIAASSIAVSSRVLKLARVVAKPVER